MSARLLRHFYALSLLGLVLSYAQNGVAAPKSESGGRPPANAQPGKPDGGAPPPCNPDPCVTGEMSLVENVPPTKILSPAEKYALIVKNSENVQRCQQLCVTAGEAQNNAARAKGVCAGAENVRLKAVSFCSTALPEDIVNPYEVIQNDKLGTPECRYFLLLVAKAQSDETLLSLKDKEADQKALGAKIDLVKIGGELSSFEGVCTGALGLEMIKKGASRPFVEPKASRIYCDLVTKSVIDTRLSHLRDEPLAPEAPVNLKPDSLAPAQRK